VDRRRAELGAPYRRAVDSVVPKDPVTDIVRKSEVGIEAFYLSVRAMIQHRSEIRASSWGMEAFAGEDEALSWVR
jgi:hypothetical protein